MINIVQAILFAWLISLPGHTRVQSPVADDHRWKKDADGSWKGSKEGKTYWYRLTEKGKVEWSENGKTWESTGTNMWADGAGRLMMISEKRLLRTTDEGKTWSNLSEWQGADGKWYKFDKDWKLWVADR